MQPASPFGWASRPVGAAAAWPVGSEPPAGDAIRPKSASSAKISVTSQRPGGAGAGGSSGNLPGTLRLYRTLCKSPTSGRTAEGRVKRRRRRAAPVRHARPARPPCRAARSRASFGVRQVPTLICARKRWWPNSSCWKRIFSDDLLRAADSKRAARRAQLVELLARHRRPSPLAPDAVHHPGVGGEELVGRVLRAVGHIGVRVDADRHGRVVPGIGRGLAVELDQRREALRRAADDREGQREAERAARAQPSSACRQRRSRSAAGPGPAAGRHRDS